MNGEGVDPMVDEEVLERLPFWESLSQRWRSELRASVHCNHYLAGQMLVEKCVDCLGMIQVLSGSVRVQVVSDKGREVSLFCLNAGDPCVLSASCMMGASGFETVMCAQEDAEVLVVPAETFQQVIDHNLTARCFAYELLALRTTTAVKVLQNIIFLTLEQRVARCLLGMARQQGSLELKVTQEEVAQQIGSAREAVARQLSVLAKAGLVEVGRGAVHILDVKGLETRA